MGESMRSQARAQAPRYVAPVGSPLQGLRSPLFRPTSTLTRPHLDDSSITSLSRSDNGVLQVHLKRRLARSAAC